MSEHTYTILFRADSRYPINRKRIRATISKILDKENLGKNIEVGVYVVGARKMKQLNRDYRDKDYATNVLSFGLQELSPQGEGFVFPADDTLHLGDVVLCYPVARGEAAKFKKMVDDWLDELVAHSMEHLLGRHHG
jgi:probable rRNA maturation factor